MLGALPLIVLAWLLSAMAASAGAPKWLAGTVAGLVIALPPGWHFWAERRRKKAGKPQGTLTRHDRWLLKAGVAIGVPLIVIVVFFRGAAWDAVKSEGLWFAKAPPRTLSEVATDRLRLIPKDARIAVDLSGVDEQAKTFLVLAFKGQIPVYGSALPQMFAVGESQSQAVFLYQHKDIAKPLGNWEATERNGRKAWIEPGETPHVAFRVDSWVVVASDAWIDAVTGALDDKSNSASGGQLARAIELRGNKPTVLSFLAQNVRINADISLTTGYLAWARTKTGIVLRGAVEGSSELRKTVDEALAALIEQRKQTFPVLKKLALQTKTDGDVLRFSLKIPTETLKAILLQPGVFAF